MTPSPAHAVFMVFSGLDFGFYSKPFKKKNACHFPLPTQPEAGRYHLYAGNACPWCHRALLAIALRGLGGAVSHTMCADQPERARRGGWVFTGAHPDPVFGAADLWEVYDRASPGYRGRCTAPMLIDKKVGRVGGRRGKPWAGRDACMRRAWGGSSACPAGGVGATRQPAGHAPLLPHARVRRLTPPPSSPAATGTPQAKRIVANASSDIVAMLNALRVPGDSGVDLRPPGLAAQIDAMNDKVDPSLGPSLGPITPTRGGGHDCVWPVQDC